MAPLKAGLATLKDKVALSKHVAVAARSADPAAPATTLMHVRLQEDLPNVHSLSEYLWTRAANYARSRKRRQEFRDQILADPEADVSVAMLIVRAARDAFVEFRPGSLKNVPSNRDPARFQLAELQITLSARLHPLADEHSIDQLACQSTERPHRLH